MRIVYYKSVGVKLVIDAWLAEFAGIHHNRNGVQLS
jgi:hypothetical protein